MLFLIIIIFIVVFLIYYVWNIDFEEGNGFTEMKKNIKEADYDTIEKESLMIDSNDKID